MFVENNTIAGNMKTTRIDPKIILKRGLEE
jgi:hypothetical protein